ncbi:hypothetical protein PHMEG_0008750 [Phytophthora megakarya]|uniref:Uncharacterized protein n=1 Tax=Phytophthora megakarya TaxID=4795 RepID=A0A225WHZ7_9STRA|nr:hypothetical protein PHMEG_0008750 [Phytophthora megakarya]
MADADGEGGAGDRPAPGPQDLATYAEELGRWVLYDYSGLREALSDDEMRSLFHWHRQTCGKPVTATRTVAMTRKAEHRARPVSALAKRIHDIAYDADRDCCYMRYAWGCVWCRDSGRRRPNEDGWGQMREDYLTAEDEKQVVDQYRNAEDQARRGGRPRQACRRWNRRLVRRNAIWNVLEQHRLRLPTIRHGAKPPHEILAVRQDWTVAGNATGTRTCVLGDGTMIIVPQGRLDNMATERLTRLESEMADLRRELDVVQEPPREERGRQDWRETAPWEYQRG